MSNKDTRKLEDTSVLPLNSREAAQMGESDPQEQPTRRKCSRTQEVEQSLIPMGGSSIPPDEEAPIAESDSDSLLTIDEICRKLKIKKSFLYSPCRRKGQNAVPVIRIGKYLRYDYQAVKEWIKKQKEVQE